jgi:methionine synthase II (cobalamin-independent)
MKVYNPKNLRDSGKILSVGCVSSRNPRIESVGEILELMEMFRDYGDCLIFTPDCGFRNLIVDGSREKGYEVAVNKLRNMVEAIKIFRELMR